MNTVSIQWHKVKYDDLDDHCDDCFYAFSSGKHLLYIGMTYRQEMKNEVRQTLKAFKVKENEVTIWIGKISYTTYLRITEQIIKDVEALLICRNQPSWNKQCKEAYNGRSDLKVNSYWCPMLKPTLVV